MKINFSTVLIAKNENKTLPRLMESLHEFQELGGEVILVDTGSTDGTQEIAKKLGCKVTEVGDKFVRTVNKADAETINHLFIDIDEDHVIAGGDKLFDYAAARNYAAALASNDMVATPDCDEVYTKLDLEKVCKAIEDGITQLEYNFVFSHDEDGNDLIKFLHSKFYNRTKTKWVGVIHEVLQGDTVRKFYGEDIIKLEHWQNPEQNRGHYIKGLALDVYYNQDNDRNLHYFARELMYTGRFKSAIKLFEKHIAMNRWPDEANQSRVHIGDCHYHMGNIREAIHNWIDAFDMNPGRREPLMKIAEHYYKAGSVDHVIAYVAAALQIKEGSFYANFQPYYENLPHEWMYWALWQKGEYNAAKRHFDICFALQPFNSKYLHDYRYYYELPKISIVAPVKGRPGGIESLINSIEELNYPRDKIETILLYDGEISHKQWEVDENFIVQSRSERLGVPKTLKHGVNLSTGEWIIYAANDMTFEPDAIMAALKTAMDNNKMFMAFNTGEVSPDEGNICEHFMIHRKMVKKLDGEIFDTDFNHVGVDNLLWAKMKKVGQAMRCDRAKIIHHHFSKTGVMDDVNKLAWSEENVKHDRELLAVKLKEL